MPNFTSGVNSRPDRDVHSMQNSRSSSAMEVNADDSSQSSLTITASVSESPRFARRGQSNSAPVTAKPGDTVTSNVVKNSSGELVNVPSKPGICQNGLNSTTNVLATITIGEVSDHNTRPNGHYIPHNNPIRPSEIRPESFQIIIKFHKNSRNYTFDVQDTLKVEELMVMIQEKIGIPLEQQLRLTYAGKNLENGMKLSHYKIEAHSTVHLTTRLRGG